MQTPWREAGPPNHHDDQVDSDQWVVTKTSLSSVPSSRGNGADDIVLGR